MEVRTYIYILDVNVRTDTEQVSRKVKMANACSNCEYSKECFDAVETDGYEVCQVKVIVGKMLKKIKNKKNKNILTERDIVYKNGRW